MKEPIIITIDGPSGVGKGTLAQMLAKHYQLHLLDSGALYRLSALHIMRQNIDPHDSAAVVAAIASLNIYFDAGKIYLDNEDVSSTIRTEAIAHIASVIAQIPALREALFKLMHAFVKPPGIVADGRDMGTVVFPNAFCKIFLTASTEIRAKRRHKQLRDNGKDATLSNVFSELIARDSRDETRENAPLEPAKEAIIIDTSNLTAIDVFEQVVQLLTTKGI